MKLTSIGYLLTFIFRSVVDVNADALYAQLSSTDDQVNGPPGEGIAIDYNSQDALFGLAWEGSKLNITKDGDYFFFAAPQVGAVDSSMADYTADYWLAIDDEFVANSGIRLLADGMKEDVIGVGAVLPFTAGQLFEFYGGGINSVNLAIQPDASENGKKKKKKKKKNKKKKKKKNKKKNKMRVLQDEGEPLVPSIIFSIFELKEAVYAQLSSTEDQILGELGTGVPLTFNSIDGIQGVNFTESKPTEIGIEEDGTYMIIIAPQVGGAGDSESLATADFWVRLNGENVANTNVRWQSEDPYTDVIIIQGVYAGLVAGDVVEVMGSGINSEIVLIEIEGQPAVPSIITTVYKIDESFPYAQLSSSITQTNGPIGTGIAIEFDSVDALNALTFDETMPNQITIEQDGAYFILAAPQVGPIDSSSRFIADYWIVVNGENAANSNVRLADKGTGNDVIVCQGVYELSAGDVVQVFGSGVNSFTEAIVEEGEPLVPSIIFSMHKV